VFCDEENAFNGGGNNIMIGIITKSCRLKDGLILKHETENIPSHRTIIRRPSYTFVFLYNGQKIG